MTRRQRDLSVLGLWLSIIGTILFGLGMLYLIYSTSRFTEGPERPVLATGQVVPWNYGGKFYYITAEQNVVFDINIATNAIFFVVCAVGAYLRKTAK